MVYFVGRVGRVTQQGIVVILDDGKEGRVTRIWLRGAVAANVGERVRAKCVARWVKNKDTFKLDFEIIELDRR